MELWFILTLWDGWIEASLQVPLLRQLHWLIFHSTFPSVLDRVSDEDSFRRRWIWAESQIHTITNPSRNQRKILHVWKAIFLWYGRHNIADEWSSCILDKSRSGCKYNPRKYLDGHQLLYTNLCVKRSHIAEETFPGVSWLEQACLLARQIRPGFHFLPSDIAHHR